MHGTDGDLIALFADRARRAGAVVHEDPEAAFRELLADGGRVVATREPDLAGLDLASVARWPECGVEGARDADLFISGCAAAIAATGSILIDSSKAGGRSIGLLPPVHAVVVGSERIVATPGDVLRRLSGTTPPSALVMIAGPSRSADIEHKLTIGVHGPGAVHILLRRDLKE
jgi:L-lactate dehydrogenase complex protein LldG